MNESVEAWEGDLTMSPSYCCGNRDSLLEQGVSAVVHCWLNYEMEDGLEEVEHVCKHKTTGSDTSIHVLTHYMYIMVNVLLRERILNDIKITNL